MTTAEPKKALKEKIQTFLRELKRKKKIHLWSLSDWDSLILSKDEVEIFLAEKEIYEFVNKKTGSYYTYKSIVWKNIPRFPALANYVLDADNNHHLFSYKPMIISMGLYHASCKIPEFKEYDTQAKIEWIKIAPILDVKKYTKDSDPKVRLEVFRRVGFMEVADLMVADKSAKIRSEITRVLPFGDPRFDKLKNDRSKWVFYEVIRKIDKNQLPLLVGNKNINSRFIKEVLNRRLME